jgi:3-methyladenine DNA glycosylase AlkD
MNPPHEIVQLAAEIRSRLSALGSPGPPQIRAVRREFSKRIQSAPAEFVLQLALHLLQPNPETHRYFAYELVASHRAAFAQLTLDDLLSLGTGLNSWFSVDCFAVYLSGPMWAQGNLTIETIAQWAQNENRWWRRAALVSTVALSRRRNREDLRQVLQICTQLAADRDDMVVKALSWALREVAKKHKEAATDFLAEHSQTLPARVIREVTNKLTIGLKTPRNAMRAPSC